MSFLSLSTDPVSQAYPEEPLAVAGDATVGEVMQLLRAQRASCALIVDGPKVSGIFTERDALRCMARGVDLTRPVTEQMTPEPFSVNPSTNMAHAIEVMSERGYRHLPVIDDAGEPTGVLSVRGIVHYLVDHFPQTIYNLPPEPGRGPAHREGA